MKQLTLEEYPKITHFLSQGAVHILLDGNYYGTARLTAEITTKPVKAPNGPHHELPILTFRETESITIASIVIYPTDSPLGRVQYEIEDGRLTIEHYIPGEPILRLTLRQS